MAYLEIWRTTSDLCGALPSLRLEYRYQYRLYRPEVRDTKKCTDSYAATNKKNKKKGNERERTNFRFCVPEYHRLMKVVL